MARDYWFAFGSQPSQTASLAPTFITFVNGAGTTYAGPAIAETPAGSGLYKVNYGATQTMSFVMDGATTGLDSSIRYIFGVLDPQDQIGLTMLAIGMSGLAFGQTAVAIGTSLVAIGNSNIALGTTNVAIGTTNGGFGLSNIALGTTNVAICTSLTAQGVSVFAGLAGIGDTASSFGNVNTQPATLFGYAKRLVEFLEGDQRYTKSSGALQYSSRGSSEILANKTVSDSISLTSRT